ncbi:MAG: nitroreductase family protein [Prolixibacteraceae bacterium]
MKEIQIAEKIKNRYSPRAYTNKKIEEETVLTLLEAVRWAASSGNSQPWRFIYATPDDPELWQKLLDCLAESNQRWAAKAPFLMLTVVQTTNPVKGRKNAHAEYGLGLAMGNFTAQASELGLQLRNMGGFSSEKARANFNIPEHFEPAVMVALGYAAEQIELEADFVVPVGESRQRRSLDEIIFKGDWSKMD